MKFLVVEKNHTHYKNILISIHEQDFHSNIYCFSIEVVWLLHAWVTHVSNLEQYPHSHTCWTHHIVVIHTSDNCHLSEDGERDVRLGTSIVTVLRANIYFPPTQLNKFLVLSTLHHTWCIVYLVVINP